jgi:hypothetical protein
MTLKTWVVTLTLPLLVSLAGTSTAAANDDRIEALSADGTEATHSADALQIARNRFWPGNDDYRQHNYDRERDCRDDRYRKHRSGDYRDCRYDDDDRNRSLHRRDIWFVDVRAANIRNRPHQRSHVLDTKYRCERVRVEHPVNGGRWYKVRAHGETGFMHASTLSQYAPRRCRHRS